MGNLPPSEINRRMREWRNDRRLEPLWKQKMEGLEARCARLEAENAEKDLIIEKLLLRIEQLETTIFGKKNKRHKHQERDDPLSGTGSSEEPSQKKHRAPHSFRRPLPPMDAVTTHTTSTIATCPDCATPLIRKEVVLRYEEDIPLQNKAVTEQTIQRGFCPGCKRIKSALPIPPQHCTLGPNVRLYVLFAVTVLGQTFTKIRAHLQGMHQLSVSEGELAAIIMEGHRRLLPAMHDIAEKIREAPAAHYDETAYPMQGAGQGNYAWVNTASNGPETIFTLGKSRGKKNAERLRGPPSDQVGVSDDYAAYDSLFTHHALCWAHPLRKLRDLAQSGVLREEQRQHCTSFYEQFKILQNNIALTIAAPLSDQERREAVLRFRREMRTMMTPDTHDPPVLARIKKTFLEHQEKYLTCIKLPNIPMTNNKAERSVRHLVIKRLLSFGSRSERGALAMETLFSVLLTLWWSKPTDYFARLRALMVV